VLHFENTRFVGYRSALQRNALDQWRTWQTYPVRLAMSPEPRRERIGRSNGTLYSAPPIRAELAIEDQLYPNSEPFALAAAWELEQPDPEVDDAEG
jgi:hypothetical protein